MRHALGSELKDRRRRVRCGVGSMAGGAVTAGTSVERGEGGSPGWETQAPRWSRGTLATAERN